MKHLWTIFADADECLLGTAKCPANSRCVNSDPGFSCDCVAGYTKVGALCQGQMSDLLDWFEPS